MPRHALPRLLKYVLSNVPVLLWYQPRLHEMMAPLHCARTPPPFSRRLVTRPSQTAPIQGIEARSELAKCFLVASLAWLPKLLWKVIPAFVSAQILASLISARRNAHLALLKAELVLVHVVHERQLPPFFQLRPCLRAVLSLGATSHREPWFLPAMDCPGGPSRRRSRR